MIKNLVNMIFNRTPRRLIKSYLVGKSFSPYLQGVQVVLPLKLARVLKEECLVLSWNTWGVEFALGKVVQLGLYHFEGSERPTDKRVTLNVVGRRLSHSWSENWREAIENWEDVAIPDDTENTVVEFTYIGEGNSGDYDPYDANDVPRLRFYCYRWNTNKPSELTIYKTDGSPEETFDLDGSWEEVEDTSYCTMLTPKASEQVLKRYAYLVSDALDSPSPKRRLEEITWITEEEIQDSLDTNFILPKIKLVRRR